ncbi:flavin monoamine oxidase family protein [Catenulispora pinisilvae]|uniref:flavin monoamine oxidase family protein n=1 Tax=Catenulispora pinisilvae TaxID=2705253 RepID=UPI001891CD5D|nr:FAD-dependent oxidoreductase [Catenulispora pinisilvae]
MKNRLSSRFGLRESGGLPESADSSENTGLTRRALVGGAAAVTLGLPAAATFALPASDAVAAAPTDSPGGGDEATSRELAREVLLVSADEQSDLKLEYLKILIDGRLPAPTARKRVLVVGAGAAGLTAARLLIAAGHDVVILEANGSRVGGRIKTFRGIFSDPRLHAEAGAMRLPDAHPLVLALGDKLGLTRRLFYNADVAPGAVSTGKIPPVTYTSFTGETWTNGPGGTGFSAPPATGLSLITSNDLTRTRNAYAQNPSALNSLFGTDLATTTTAAASAAFAPVVVSGTTPIATQLDGWTQLFRDFDGYSTQRYLVENQGWDTPRLQAVGTVENLTSRLHYSLIPTLFDHALISPTNRYWEFENGTASLTDALAAPLKGLIRTNRRMTKLIQDGQGVTIETTAESGSEDSCDGAPIGPVETFHGDYAIIAVPFSALRFCQITPLMSYPKRRAVEELHYDSATKVLLEFKTRFWERGPGGFTGGGNISDYPSRFTYFPSHAPQGSRGGVVLAAYCWSDDAMRWDSLTPGERYALALADMARIYGNQVYTEFTGIGATQSWARARYALGEAVVVTPGQLHELHPATRTVEGRVHFAGEHTSLKPAWIEGALESAVRTFLEVHAR